MEDVALSRRMRRAGRTGPASAARGDVGTALGGVGARSGPSCSCGSSGSATSSGGRRRGAPMRTAADRRSGGGNWRLPRHPQGSERVREVQVPRKHPRRRTRTGRCPHTGSPPGRSPRRLSAVVTGRQDGSHAHLPGGIVETVTDLDGDIGGRRPPRRTRAAIPTVSPTRISLCIRVSSTRIEDPGPRRVGAFPPCGQLPGDGVIVRGKPGTRAMGGRYDVSVYSWSIRCVLKYAPSFRIDAFIIAVQARGIPRGPGRGTGERSRSPGGCRGPRTPPGPAPPGRRSVSPLPIAQPRSGSTPRPTTRRGSKRSTRRWRAAFIPLVPDASSGRRGLFSHTSTPCTMYRATLMS